MPLARASESTRPHDLPPNEVVFGQTPLMAVAREKLERVAETTIPVLLQGESGTGKEILARLLHAVLQSFQGRLDQGGLPRDSPLAN